MGEARDGLRLAHDPRGGLGSVDHLDRDGALQTLVPGAVDRAEAAAADRALDPEPVENHFSTISPTSTHGVRFLRRAGHNSRRVAFLDDEEELGGSPEQERPRRPERRDREISGPQRRRQQFLLRRLIGVGVGVGFLILLVVGFRGCLEARSDRGLRDYSQSISTIMQESQGRGEEFFTVLQDDTISEQDLENRISGIRSASSGLLERAEKHDTPTRPARPTARPPSPCGSAATPSSRSRRASARRPPMPRPRRRSR